MTVYIVTRGCYSDYEICAVSLDKTKAEKLAKVYTTRYDEASVEEWETDTEADIHALNGRHPYSVTFYPDEEPSVYKIDYVVPDFKPCVREIKYARRGMCLDVQVYATDEAAALKIASDKRAQYLAEKEGIV